MTEHAYSEYILKKIQNFFLFQVFVALNVTHSPTAPPICICVIRWGSASMDDAYDILCICCVYTIHILTKLFWYTNYNILICHGTWLARPAGKHDIVPDICNTYRTRCPYMKSNCSKSYKFSSISVKYRPNLIIWRYCIWYCTRHWIQTFIIGWWRMAKTVKIENQARYWIQFSSMWRKNSILGPILSGKDG